MKYLLLALFFLAIVIESSVVTSPFFLVLLIVIASVTKKDWIFAMCLLGFLLDFSLLRIPGSTSAFFLITLLIIYLYDRKFETSSLPFVVIASCVGSFLYSILFFQNEAIVIAIVSSVFAFVSFLIFSIFFRNEKRPYDLSGRPL